MELGRKGGEDFGYVWCVLVLPARDSPYLLRMNSEDRMTCELAAVDMVAICLFESEEMMLILFASADAGERAFGNI